MITNLLKIKGDISFWMKFKRTKTSEWKQEFNTTRENAIQERDIIKKSSEWITGREIQGLEDKINELGQR